MKFLSFEILYIIFNFEILKFFETFELSIFFGKIWPPTDGISSPLPIEYRPPYTWYFDLPAYLLIRNGGGGVQFTIQGGSVFNKGVQYTMDVNRPRVQFTMGFKIPYDTGFDLHPWYIEPPYWKLNPPVW